MNINDINPLIRYAIIHKESNFSQELVKAYECRLFYILEGGCIILADEKEYKMNLADILIALPNTAYKLFDFKENTRVVLLDFDYSSNNGYQVKEPSPVSAYRADLIYETPSFEDEPLLNDVLYIQKLNDIADELVEITSEFKEMNRYYRQRMSAMLKRVIFHILYVKASEDITNTNVSDIIIKYIHKNYNKKITNKELASLVNYHEMYINNIMQKSTGMTAHQYLIKVRIRKAVHLLRFTNMSIKEIAAKTGFQNAMYFSNCFKKHMGVSPTQFRLSI